MDQAMSKKTYVDMGKNLQKGLLGELWRRDPDAFTYVVDGSPVRKMLDLEYMDYTEIVPAGQGAFFPIKEPQRVPVGEWRVTVDTDRNCGILWHQHGGHWETCDTYERCMLCGIRCPEGAKMMAMLKATSFLGR
jgi:hypothetical protein